MNELKENVEEWYNSYYKHYDNARLWSMWHQRRWKWTFYGSYYVIDDIIKILYGGQGEPIPMPRGVWKK